VLSSDLESPQAAEKAGSGLYLSSGCSYNVIYFLFSHGMKCAKIGYQRSENLTR